MLSAPTVAVIAGEHPHEPLTRRMATISRQEEPMYTAPVDEPFSGNDRCHRSPSGVGEAIWRVAYVGFATMYARWETGKVRLALLDTRSDSLSGADGEALQRCNA
jgi:hypothetical protein